MSIGSISSASAFNIDGIVSGMKTADIINAIVSRDTASLTQLKKQQTDIQTRDKAYQDIKARVSTFKSAAQTLLLPSNVNAKSASSSTATVATATANSNAANGQFTVNVNKLATATSLSSSAAIGTVADTTATTLLSSAN